MIDKIYGIVNGIEYSRDIPEEAKELAKENNCIVIVGGSDNLMYVYGAKSFLVDYIEHGYGWGGTDFSEYENMDKEDYDIDAIFEINQLGLEIYWCGKIETSSKKIENYNTDKSGAFSYKVKEGIRFKDFTVYENSKKEEVYCTGIIIQLPDDFKSSLENKDVQ